MSLSVHIVESIQRIMEKGLPEEIRNKVKLHMIDTIAISLAAYQGAPVALQAIQGISIGATSGSSRVIGSNLRLPPAYAAFSNAALAHALDFDDIHDEARVHPTPVTLSAALATADITNHSAVDLITAVGIGNELICRLGYAIKPKGTGTDSNWYLSQLFGYLGAAVTAGLIIGLNKRQFVHALGLAYMQAAGGKESGVGVGANARAIYPAFAAMGGVQAALLAYKEMTAPLSSLDGKTGLFQIYLGRNLTETEKKVVLDDQRWIFTQTSIKLFPSCRYSHPYIKAALDLHHKLKGEQIKKIIIGVNETARMLCEPLEQRRKPKTMQDAKFSIPFMVAFTLTYGQVNLNILTEESLQHPSTLSLAERISIATTQEDTIGIPIGDVQVMTDYHEYRVNNNINSAEVHLKDVKDKFVQCCQFAQLTEREALWEKLNNNIEHHFIAQLPIVDEMKLNI